MKQLQIINTNSYNSIALSTIKCPYCHLSQVPNALCILDYNIDSNKLIIAAKCTNCSCERIYLYSYDERSKFSKTLNLAEPLKETYDEIIHSISENFCRIYNEAYAAEQMNLEDICGVGYRKALEFLIKDYIISGNQEKKDEIEKKRLGICIETYISNSNIKNVAKRAAWLGNDETHYIRKWDTKDIKDLKGLIKLCVHWIIDEIKTAEILKDMPEQ